MHSMEVGNYRESLEHLSIMKRVDAGWGFEIGALCRPRGATWGASPQMRIELPPHRSTQSAPLRFCIAVAATSIKTAKAARTAQGSQTLTSNWFR